MTLRERVMAVLKGGKADKVPLTIYFCLLPGADPVTGFRYGSGYRYDIIPEKFPAINKLHERGLAFIGWSPTHIEKHNNVTFESKEVSTGQGKEIITCIKTPVGEVSERAGFDITCGSRWVKEHFIKSVNDYKVMQYLYEHTTVKAAWETYDLDNQRMGDKGIVIAEILPIPIQWLQVEIMGAMTWSEGVILHTLEFDELLESLTNVYMHQVEIAAASSAEVIWCPDNITGTMISPDLFNKYCKPIYDRACSILKEAGKLTFAHYDGFTKSLKECIANTNIDIIEAFTPLPMGDMTVLEAREAWPDKVLNVNVPGSLFTEPAKVIQQYINEYMEQAGDLSKFLIGCSENYDLDYFDHAFIAIADAMDKQQS